MRHFQGQVGAWIGIGICFFLLVGTIAARTATEGSLGGERRGTDDNRFISAGSENFPACCLL